MDGANSDNVSFSAHSKSIVQIETEINDLLAIISSTTGDTSGIHPNDLLLGGALNVAKAKLAQKRCSLEQLKTSSGAGGIGDNSGNIGTQGAVDKILGSHVVGGIDTVDVLAEKVLRSNTMNNAVQSITAGNIDNLLTPVWKYSQYDKRLASIANMPTMVWTKISPFKSVLQIKSIPTTAKFGLLWSKFCLDPFSSDTPVTKISEFISIIEKKKYDWTKNPEAQGILTNSFCALTKTSPEVFGCDWKAAGELQPSLGASIWTAAVKALGCSFKLAYKINMTKKGIIKSDIKDLKAAGKSLSFNVPGICVQTKAGQFIHDKVDRLPFAKKIRIDKKFTRNHQSYL